LVIVRAAEQYYKRSHKKILFPTGFAANLGRYLVMYTMVWDTIYPSTIEPSGCALCQTKPFKNFKCLSTIHIDLVGTGPHNSISST
jgi:hypothetical protein